MGRFRDIHWRNITDAWIDWRDGTLSFRECLFMLGILRGQEVEIVFDMDEDEDEGKEPQWT